jgi:hypothetical protein
MTVVPDRDSTDYAQALLKAQMRRLTRARSDPAAFYEYVMREETARTRISTLPFQKLVFQFAMEHEKCVIRLPVGGSKTYTMAALTLYLLGEDPTARGAIISATQGQASKPLSLVRNYIMHSAELHAVYPALRPSQVDGDPWTQTAITVDRPFGIRDPSLVAIGVTGRLPGSRLSWCLVDDILNAENTATPEQRETVRKLFTSTVLSRMDVDGSRLIVTNTPWVGPTSSDAGDLTYWLEAKGWPTLTITIWGDVFVTNAPNFDSDQIRPANDCDGPDGRHRLSGNDDPVVIRETYEDAPDLGEPANQNVDVEEATTFWPQKYSRSAIEEIRKLTTAREFAQNYEMKARGESEDRIKEGWITQSKTDAQRMGHYGFCSSIDDLRLRIAAVDHDPVRPSTLYAGAPDGIDLIVATGVDLAIGKKKANARTVLFTIAVLPPSNRRIILDIEAGRWTGREIVQKILAKNAAFGSIVRVENNAAQDFLLQWAREEDRSVPIKAHTTGRNKADPTHGVESMFIEIEQGAWVIPCGQNGKSPPNVEAWLQDLRQYTPEAHTGDYLMASWLADWQVKKMGANVRRNRGPSVAALNYR